MSINLKLKNTKLLQSFGIRVRELRLKKGLSQEELAYASEIELSQIHRIESGKTNLTFYTLAAVASGLGISISELTKGV